VRIRDAKYVTGGYVVHSDRVLLLWHLELARWVPAGGKVELASGEYPHEAVLREVKEESGLDVEIQGLATLISDGFVRGLPMPAAMQEIDMGDGRRYLDFVYYCTVDNDQVVLEYTEARAYRWFTLNDLEKYPLYEHVREHAKRALSFQTRLVRLEEHAL
jgi:ADP-ribose pyrophosphatase YjhB (NUDIX family)